MASLGFNTADLPTGAEMLADSLAKIDGAMRANTDPAIRGSDPTDPGLLLLLDQAVDLAGEPNAGLAIAISVAFELGRCASGKVDHSEVARLGGLIAGARRKDAANHAWRDAAKAIWRETRGAFLKDDPRRKSQVAVAEIVAAEVPNAPDRDRIVKTIRDWDRGAS